MSNRAQVTVSNYEEISLKPKITDPDIVKLLPNTLEPKFVSFEISGVSNAVSNGIRRTLLDEMPFIAMKMGDLKTDDEFLIPEMIEKRIRMIPILQTTPLKTTFTLNARNDTRVVRDVKSSEIKSNKQALPFDGTYTLFTLRPGKQAQISEITIVSNYGHIDAAHCQVSSPASVALDQEPINSYTGTGISVSVSNPRKWRISFITTGGEDPQKLLRDACDNLVERLRGVKQILPTITSRGDQHELRIVDSATIGNLLMKTIIELYPQIPACVYDEGHNERTVTLRIMSSDDVSLMISNAIAHVTAVYGEIRATFA